MLVIMMVPRSFRVILGKERVSRASGIKVAVAIEYLKKAIDTGGIWARTTLVLIMDKPQNTTVRTISSKAKWRSFFPSFIPSAICYGRLKNVHHN